MNVRIVGVERVWDCMLCTYVNEEGGDGERVVSEELSQLSYTLRYVSLTDLGRLYQVGLITCTGHEQLKQMVDLFIMNRENEIYR